MVFHLMTLAWIPIPRLYRFNVVFSSPLNPLRDSISTEPQFAMLFVHRFFRLIIHSKVFDSLRKYPLNMPMVSEWRAEVDKLEVMVSAKQRSQIRHRYCVNDDPKKN